MANRSRFDLIDQILGGTLRQDLVDLRKQGATYDEMVQHFAGKGISLSRETLRRWANGVAA